MCYGPVCSFMIKRAINNFSVALKNVKTSKKKITDTKLTK